MDSVLWWDGQGRGRRDHGGFGQVGVPRGVAWAGGRGEDGWAWLQRVGGCGLAWGVAYALQQGLVGVALQLGGCDRDGRGAPGFRP